MRGPFLSVVKTLIGAESRLRKERAALFEPRQFRAFFIAKGGMSRGKNYRFTGNESLCNGPDLNKLTYRRKTNEKARSRKNH